MLSVKLGYVLKCKVSATLRDIKRGGGREILEQVNCGTRIIKKFQTLGSTKKVIIAYHVPQTILSLRTRDVLILMPRSC